MPTVAVAKFRQNKSLSRTLFAYTKQKARDGFKVGDEARGEKGALGSGGCLAIVA